MLEQLAKAYELDPAELVSASPVAEPLMDAMTFEAITKEDFDELPPFKQLFNQQ